MPIRPQPLKLTCRKCGWSRIVAPKSDVILTEEEMPNNHCPKCGSVDLVRTVPGLLDTVFRMLSK